MDDNHTIPPAELAARLRVTANLIEAEGLSARQSYVVAVPAEHVLAWAGVAA